MDKKTIPFTENDVKDYLDKTIRKWRGKLESIENKYKYTGDAPLFSIEDYTEKTTAIANIDAYQSVRTSLFGETLE